MDISEITFGTKPLVMIFWEICCEKCEHRRIEQWILLPAEKGGLRRADVRYSVCLSVCLSVAVLIDQSESRYGLTDQSESRYSLTDQSEDREGVCGHRLTNQREGRVCVGQGWPIREHGGCVDTGWPIKGHGGCVWAQADQSEGREGVCWPRLTNQRAGRVCRHRLTNQRKGRVCRHALTKVINRSHFCLSISLTVVLLKECWSFNLP